MFASCNPFFKSITNFHSFQGNCILQLTWFRRCRLELYDLWDKNTLWQLLFQQFLVIGVIIVFNSFLHNCLVIVVRFLTNIYDVFQHLQCFWVAQSKFWRCLWRNCENVFGILQLFQNLTEVVLGIIHKLTET